MSEPRWDQSDPFAIIDGYQPARLGVDSAWYGHVPFGYWLTTTLKPATLVELGTHAGVSYSSFCDAVIDSRLPTAAYAVDTWLGDKHAGEYGDEVYQDWLGFHEGRYASFSNLMRMTFDEARDEFEDNSIDLLHIDGLHTFAAVSHDVESWLPKVARLAVSCCCMTPPSGVTTSVSGGSGGNCASASIRSSSSMLTASA